MRDLSRNFKAGIREYLSISSILLVREASKLKNVTKSGISPKFDFLIFVLTPPPPFGLIPLFVPFFNSEASLANKMELIERYSPIPLKFLLKSLVSHCCFTCFPYSNIALHWVM